jgi:hypothetical protein
MANSANGLPEGSAPERHFVPLSQLFRKRAERNGTAATMVTEPSLWTASAQGLPATDGADIHAEMKARALRKETGETYRTKILQTFVSKAEARACGSR